MRSRVVTAVALSIASVSLACNAGPSAFVCRADDECRLDTVVGTCQLDGWCSFPDDACPSSERYGMHAGDGNAGACVASGDGGTDTPPSSTTDASSAGATTPSPDPSSSGASLTLGVGSSGGASTDEGGTSRDPGTSATSDTDSASSGDTGPEPLPCDLDEEFLGMKLDATVWNSWEENGAEIQVADGQLAVVLPSGAVAVAGIQTSAGDLHGRAVTMVVGAGPNPDSTAEQSLIFNQDGGDFRVTITTGEVIVSTYDGTYEALAADPIDVGIHDHLRVGEAGGSMFVERSAGPNAWETIWAGAPPIEITALTLTARVQAWEPLMDPGMPAYEAIRICPLP